VKEFSKTVIDLTKLLPNVWWLPFLGHGVHRILYCHWKY